MSNSTTVSQEEAYNNLKDRLVSKPVLKVFNPNADTELHCDPSSVGLSGMLLQRSEDKRLHLVHAVSKKTTSAERHYHSSKQELMAVVWSMCRLRPYLIGISKVFHSICIAYTLLMKHLYLCSCSNNVNGNPPKLSSSICVTSSEDVTSFLILKFRSKKILIKKSKIYSYTCK
ncbi:unnamed protein product [Macrosiphum euphorbiae]|uniref:Reverse transcriptase/retrotransposon-derived protein RNase H-like domain-containing protein n=1 Tax=Macrosiphum euphorbiae TaxID=13131 RepID=A0AAV0XNF7_9HEMI|nr:unnamed protein product [Macrosiphum euphorbiae]